MPIRTELVWYTPEENSPEPGATVLLEFHLGTHEVRTSDWGDWSRYLTLEPVAYWAELKPVAALKEAPPAKWISTEQVFGTIQDGALQIYKMPTGEMDASWRSQEPAFPTRVETELVLNTPDGVFRVIGAGVDECHEKMNALLAEKGLKYRVYKVGDAAQEDQPGD